MTAKAQEFIAANAVSPVVSGYAIEQDPRKPGKGCVYTLKNGQRFRLSLADCQAIDMLKWDI